MGKIFEKLLINNSLITDEELKYYKNLQNSQPEKHLGEILLQKGLIEPDILQQLLNAEQESQKNKSLLKEQRKDKKVLEVVQQIGIVRQKEIIECMQQKSELEKKGEHVFLVDLFVQHKYLTPYLVLKFYRKGNARVPLPEGISNYEDLVSDLPQYLQDRFLAKLAIKNNIISKIHINMCWDILKQYWPRKSLAEIIQEKNLLSHRKLKTLLNAAKERLPQQYPYLDAQIRDTYLAKLLVRRNFLSPWRINKCLAEQLTNIRDGVYIPLRRMLVKEGYLTDYQFDKVLQQYGLLVTMETPAGLVPTDEIRILAKEDIQQAIQEATSDIHLIIDEEDGDIIQFADSISEMEQDNSEIAKKEKQAEKIEIIDTIADDIEIEDLESGEMDEIESDQDLMHRDIGENIIETAGRTGSFIYNPDTIEEILRPPINESIMIPDENIEEHADWMELAVEHEEVDIAISPINTKDFLEEDLTPEDLEKKAKQLFNHEDDEDDEEDIFIDDEFRSSGECDVAELSEDLI